MLRQDDRTEIRDVQREGNAAVVGALNAKATREKGHSAIGKGAVFDLTIKPKDDVGQAALAPLRKTTTERGVARCFCGTRAALHSHDTQDRSSSRSKLLWSHVSRPLQPMS